MGPQKVVDFVCLDSEGGGNFHWKVDTDVPPWCIGSGTEISPAFGYTFYFLKFFPGLWYKIFDYIMATVFSSSSLFIEKSPAKKENTNKADNSA